jgi:ankyrin repeat protein
MSDWFHAVETGDLPMVKKMLDLDKSLLHNRSHDGETAIIKASENGRTPVVRFLLKNGANPNDADTTSAGQTPLIHAAFNGHTKIIKLLLDAGADIEKKNNIPGEGPLINAVQEGKIEVAKLLLERGANPNVENTEGETVHMLATTFLRGDDRAKMCALLEKSMSGGKKTRKRSKRRRNYSKRSLIL